MSNRFLVWAVNAVIVSTFLTANLVLVNLISGEASVRLDLTERDAYTLSRVTLDEMDELDSELVVHYYISRETLPGTREYKALEREMLDRLTELERHARAGMRIEVEDPLDGRKFVAAEDREKLTARNILPIEKEVVVDGRSRTYEFYSSVKLTYRGREEILNELDDARDLEYEFVTAVSRLREVELPDVGFALILEEEEHDLRGQIEGQVFGILGEHADVRIVDLAKGPAELQDLEVLFVLARAEVDDIQRYEIDQFVMQGGSLVLCTDVFNLYRQSGGGRFGGEPKWEIKKTGLEDLVAGLGARLQTDLVFDIEGVQKRPDTIQSGAYLYQVDLYYSFMVNARRESFNPEFPVTRNIEGLTFWFPHSIVPDDARLREKDIRYDYLIHTSDKSWVEGFNDGDLVGYTFLMRDNMISEQAERQIKRWHSEHGDDRARIAAVLRGEFTSHYADKKVPEGVATANYSVDQLDRRSELGGRQTILAGGANRVVLIGDADWVRLIREFKANRDFLLALTRWLSQERDFSPLINKSAPAPPLYDEADEKASDHFADRKGFYIFLMTGISPLLVLLFGVVKMIIRYQERLAQAAADQHPRGSR